MGGGSLLGTGPRAKWQEQHAETPAFTPTIYKDPTTGQPIRGPTAVIHDEHAPTADAWIHSFSTRPPRYSRLLDTWPLTHWAMMVTLPSWSLSPPLCVYVCRPLPVVFAESPPPLPATACSPRKASVTQILKTSSSGRLSESS